MAYSIYLFVWVLTPPSRNVKKSESEMSVLIDYEPPKRRRKGKGEKGETVRVSPQSSRLMVDFDDFTLV